MTDMVLTNQGKPSEGFKPVPRNKFCFKCEQFLETVANFKLQPDTHDGFTRHCNQCEKARSGQRQRAARECAIDIYGGSCAACGAADSPFNPLEFDHIGNGGGEHRNHEKPPTMISRIAMTGERITDYTNKETGESVPVEIQLLCKSCHRSKTEADWPGFLDWKFAQSRKVTA